MEHKNIEVVTGAEAEDKNIFAVDTAAQETVEMVPEADVAVASGTEISAVEPEEAGVYVHKFKEPFAWMGNSYSELKFNFGKLRGVDAMAVYTELRVKGVMVVNPHFSQDYLLGIASKASGLGTDAIKNMPFADFETILGQTRNFIPNVAFA